LERHFNQGHDFGYGTEYTGFVVDIANKRVYPSEMKRREHWIRWDQSSLETPIKDKVIRYDKLVADGRVNGRSSVELMRPLS
jgi:hypothetical protein